eukprot:gene15591-8808_t
MPQAGTPRRLPHRRRRAARARWAEAKGIPLRARVAALEKRGDAGR